MLSARSYENEDIDFLEEESRYVQATTTLASTHWYST